MTDAGLEQVLPKAPRKVTVSGVEVTIHPVTVIQLPGLLDVLDEMTGLPALPKDTPLVPFLVRHASGPLLSFSALVTGETKEWIGSLALDDGVKLYGAVVEENVDFFVERLLPAMKALIPGLRLVAALWGGLQSSPGSSGTDTGGPTCSDTP